VGKVGGVAADFLIGSELVRCLRARSTTIEDGMSEGRNPNRPPNYPESAADVAEVLRQARGRPVPFTQVSEHIRHARGKGDDPSSQRYGEVRTWRGLVHHAFRGTARKVGGEGWILV
jgi:hypothetical protein